MTNTDVVSTKEYEPFIGSSKETQRYLKAIEIALETQDVPFFIGDPGVGKTALIGAVARRTNRLLRTLTVSTMDPADVAGLPVVSHKPDGTVVTEFTKPYWFYELEKYALDNPAGAVLFIDEITTAVPPVQAALLTFIQDRRIGKYMLPDNVLIVAAGNPVEQSPDGWLLAPPTANRLTHIRYNPSITDWFEGMKVAWNAPVSEAEKRMRGYIVGFLTANRGLVNACPTDPVEAGGAWPSMRQWDKLARQLAKVDGDIPLASMIAVGKVGEAAGTAFIRWLKQLSLPDYNQVLTHPTAVNWADLRSDELYMVLSIVVDNITTENWEQSLKVFEAAKAAHKDDVVHSIILGLRKQIENVFVQAGEPVPDDFKAKIARVAFHIVGDLVK